MAMRSHIFVVAFAVSLAFCNSWFSAVAAAEGPDVSAVPRSQDPTGPDAKAPATRARPDDLRSLVARSPQIFIAEVSGKDPYLDKRRNVIVTRYQLAIRENIVGVSAGTRITLDILGGRIGDDELRVSHLPILDIGQSYVIFADLSRKTYNPIVSGNRGVFLVGRDGGVFTLEGFAVAGVQDGQLRLAIAATDGRRTEQTGGRQAAKMPAPTVSGGVASAVSAEPPTPARPLSTAQFAHEIISLSKPKDR